MSSITQYVEQHVRYDALCKDDVKVGLDTWQLSSWGYLSDKIDDIIKSMSDATSVYHM